MFWCGQLCCHCEGKSCKKRQCKEIVCSYISSGMQFIEIDMDEVKRMPFARSVFSQGEIERVLTLIKRSFCQAPPTSYRHRHGLSESESLPDYYAMCIMEYLTKLCWRDDFTDLSTTDQFRKEIVSDILR